MDEPLRILIAEDIDLVGEAFEALLATEAGYDVVARVGRGDQVVRAALAHRPHIALLDIDMPGMTGIEACAELTEALPACKVILLTALPGSGHLPRALAAGASGYLVKSMTAKQLIDGIQSVAAGGTVIDPTLAAEALRSGPSPLTDRECDILRLVDQDISTDQIAEELFLSKGTVRNYLSNAMTKLDAPSRVEAVKRAKNRGLI
ncbi:response regulator transcription factor [Yimella sp. cx-51]|uniref:response regulator n=1 Tax=Yimella sp. cx-51 TaxID=2770551 RepID=UPI00165E717B|nr:response regulator transcription factor [Yimella sp. cx-51]MBC9956534.1 response regulator transcription factor [Yimella sp. cx-51]QTH38362.1 response regulator transcription factor [Yimella sp. cx-51]